MGILLRYIPLPCLIHSYIEPSRTFKLLTDKFIILTPPRPPPRKNQMFLKSNKVGNV